jgi:hypothetical protein
MHIVKISAGRNPCRTALLSLAGLIVAFNATASPPPPVISGSPATTDVAGQLYSFTPTASGPKGYTLKFTISGRPSWASFSNTTGRLWGTPTLANVGTYSNIVIRVTDGLRSALLAPFSLTVKAPTDKVTISGQPATSVNVGTAYSFKPTATSSSGYSLTFHIQNAPSWTTFNSATGQLSGSPTAAFAGTYSNIIISASDSTTSASLAPFSISVNQISNGSATVNWTPPLYNTDGSVLTDLAGYKIHYGTASNNLTQTVQVANAGIASYTVSNLGSGTWYFGVSAYDTSGQESALSNIGSKAIP